MANLCQVNGERIRIETIFQDKGVSNVMRHPVKNSDVKVIAFLAASYKTNKPKQVSSDGHIFQFHDDEWQNTSPRNLFLNCFIFQSCLGAGRLKYGLIVLSRVADRRLKFSGVGERFINLPTILLCR